MTEQPSLSKAYDPREVEDKWYRYWTDQDLFRARVDETKEPFTIVIPPPNVTGSLHIGHALNNTLQDIIIRRKRMQGFMALWLPGTDHASIATHVKVEQELAQEGLDRHDLGREGFLERAWSWKERYGATITSQLKRLGTSCDWSRERFTMDEMCSRAVIESFIRLYERGLIYRGDRITNWCPACQTVISDLEVEHESTAGKLYHVRYFTAEGDGHISVATTRPETILGDTAIAVHPDDERYQTLIGREVLVPVLNRSIPVVADAYVDPEFGTGAVKVTPAHDPNDFEIGVRHDLPSVVVIGQDGHMTEEAGPFAGLERYECRRQLVKRLDEEGYLLQIEEHEHAVGHCHRCTTTVEPLVSKQWFVSMEPLAKPAIDVVKKGEVSFIPSRFSRVYLNWMENIRDWCISRQLWWGHRIPAWYCQSCDEIVVSADKPQGRCGRCQAEDWEQDADVLDTWFSSALWPFSTLGWPEKTADLEYFYPTQVLVTAYDIIFFWVARMIFSALEFTDRVPFTEVFINGLVRDSEGKKMSRTGGTGIDPLEVIDQYGADTLRFSLVVANAPGNDQRFYREKIEGARNFTNKIWNAARFVLMNLGDYQPPVDRPPLGVVDRWILGRLERTVRLVNEHIDSYDMGEAAQQLYDFIWSEFCDWYLEMAKISLNSEDAEAKAATRYTLWRTLETTMRLLHPLMPFVTEEIWQALPHEGDSIMLASYPQAGDDEYEEEHQKMELIMQGIRAIRNLRADFRIPPGQPVDVMVKPDARSQQVWQELSLVVQSLAQTHPLKGVGDRPPRQAATAVVSGATLYLPLSGLVDFDQEMQRLDKEIETLKKELKRSQGRLGNEQFRSRAPREVVAKEEAREADFQAKLERLYELKAVFTDGDK